MTESRLSRGRNRVPVNHNMVQYEASAFRVEPVSDIPADTRSALNATGVCGSFRHVRAARNLLWGSSLLGNLAVPEPRSHVSFRTAACVSCALVLRARARRMFTSAC
jgi:hypothetical protein